MRDFEVRAPGDSEIDLRIGSHIGLQLGLPAVRVAKSLGMKAITRLCLAPSATLFLF